MIHQVKIQIQKGADDIQRYLALCVACDKPVGGLYTHRPLALQVAELHQYVMEQARIRALPPLTAAEIQALQNKRTDYRCWNHQGYAACVCPLDCKRCSGCQCTCECYICGLEKE